MIKTFEKEMQAEVQRLREVDKAVAERKDQARLRSLERAATGQADPISANNEAVPIETALEMYGFKEKGSRWLSPNSESGVPGVVVRDGHIFSHHSGDAGIGMQAGTGIVADSFDLSVHFEHGGDFNRSLIAAGDRFTVQDPVKGDIVSINKFNQRQYKRQQSHEEVLPDVRQDEKKPAPLARVITLDQIRQKNPQTEFLIQGFLNKGEGLLIHATGGLGKSMLSQWIALQAAMGQAPLFDVFPIKRRLTSLFIQTENSAATVNSRVRLMVGNDPKSIEALKKIAMPLIRDDVLSPGRPFSNPDFKTWLTGTIDAAVEHIGQAIDILWIDPLISFCSGDENDSAKMRLELDALNELCQVAKVTPIVVHHDNRNGDYRGASAIFDWCRAMIGLKLEFVGSNRITDQDPDGQVTGKRTAAVPCVRMIHEKANNMRKFDPLLLRMCRNLNFEAVRESVSPEHEEQGRLLQQALTDLGGTAQSTNDLSNTYCNLSGVSRATAKRHIKIAVDNGYIIQNSLILQGNQTYVYSQTG